MSTSQLTVLMADDDPDERQLTCNALRQSGGDQDLRWVEDGVELLDYLKRRGRFADPKLSPRPSLILLDLNMPRMTGHEALREIKQDPALRRIPVVVLTNSREERDLIGTYRLGANSFVVKPIAFTELVKVMSTLRSYWLEVAELPPPPVEQPG